jgi:hypothetical protein
MSAPDTFFMNGLNNNSYSFNTSVFGMGTGVTFLPRNQTIYVRLGRRRARKGTAVMLFFFCIYTISL